MTYVPVLPRGERVARPIGSLPRPLSLTAALGQDRVWIRGERLADMDRHHRANLIPFLRRNRVVLYSAVHGVPGEEFDAEQAEEWLEATPLMRRLVELEQGRPIDERRETHVRNQSYEAETGYQKIDLRVTAIDESVDDDRWLEQ